MHQTSTSTCVAPVLATVMNSSSTGAHFVTVAGTIAQVRPAESSGAPAGENSLSMCCEVASALKLWPEVTATASSPGGKLTCQSLLATQLSKGRYMTVLGASLLEGLAYITPYAPAYSNHMNACVRHCKMTYHTLCVKHKYILSSLCCLVSITYCML